MTIYDIKADFMSEDKRYLDLVQGKQVTGLVNELGWVFGIQEDPQGVGFMPESYLMENTKLRG